MTRDHPKDSTEYCCVGREQFAAASARAYGRPEM